MKRPIPKADRVRARSMRTVRRRRYVSSGIDRYAIERHIEPIYRNCRTAAQLRERYRAFVENDLIWRLFEDLQANTKETQATLRYIEKAAKKIGGVK